MEGKVSSTDVVFIKSENQIDGKAETIKYVQIPALAMADF